jgi:hypothetical protein
MWHSGGNLSATFCVSVRPWLHSDIRSFFLDPEDIGVLGMGTAWNFVKEQGSYNLVQNIWHKGPVLRPRCLGPVRARTQILLYPFFPYDLCSMFTVSSYIHTGRINPLWYDVHPNTQKFTYQLTHNTVHIRHKTVDYCCITTDVYFKDQ